MKRRFGPSLYFANDKVIFDSLNQHAVKADLIRELLNERGILVSAETPKERLAQYFSRLTADYFDHKSIASKLGRVAKRERITYSELKGDIKQSDVVQSLNEIKAELQEKDCTIHIEVVGDRIVALISYQHIDYSKTDLRQVEPRDAIIEFTRNGKDGYVVRSTQNVDIDPLVEQVVSRLDTATLGSVDRVRISLESYTDPMIRTRFFENLVKSIKGYSFITITEAYCFKPKARAPIKDDDDEEEQSDIEKSPYVERVTLRGDGVNKSFIIDDLYKNNYYIIKVVWQIRLQSRVDSDIYELEAQFGKPDSCTGFSYQIRSVFICDDGNITTKKRSPKKEEMDTIYRLIESSAILECSKLATPS
ncbi:hypothetical protein INH39_19455 [Massilia violaceinigra]|uniref:Uncharacterized protein n=1 Tax=Massilia violaceinigra TaxID=2045208 RepID=A0ABY3ZYZ1_9BURK|nr:hypothetical protein [Massilia violaceinigra]UOD27677.1 hypothetical protein INH39_19455 [Massilia violaceinigra]